MREGGMGRGLLDERAREREQETLSAAQQRAKERRYPPPPLILASRRRNTTSLHCGAVYAILHPEMKQILLKEASLSLSVASVSSFSVLHQF